MCSVPFGRGQYFLGNAGKVTNTLAGGWNLNFIFSAQSGQPINVGCPVSASTSDFGCNATLVPGVNPYAGGRTQTQWLNPAAFAQPPAATAIGQTNFAPLGGARDQVRSPGFNNLDASIFKKFPIHERTNLEFRLETFNTLITFAVWATRPVELPNIWVQQNYQPTRHSQFCSSRSVGAKTVLLINRGPQITETLNR